MITQFSYFHVRTALRLPHNFNNTALLKELQEAITQGDEAAFTQLYQVFYKKLVHFSSSLIHSQEIAEEVVEDVFVKLWSDKSLTAAIDNIKVYLYVAVKNKSLNALSQKARQLITAPFDYLDSSVEDFHSDPYDVLVTREMMKKMQAAIHDLPPRCKMIFKLIREDGLKYKEVAEILNISVNTIDTQMAIAVKRICQALQLMKPSFTFPLRSVKK